MPKSGNGAETLDSRRDKTKSSPPPQSIAHHPSDRLHVALMVAIGVVALIAIAFPLTRSSVSAEETDSAPVLAASDGFSAAVESHTQTLVKALTQASQMSGAEGPALSQTLESLPGADLVPRSLLVTVANVLVQGAMAGAEGQQGLAMELQQPVGFTLHEGGLPSDVFSTRRTVGGALMALGAGYSEYDYVWPPPDTSLSAGLHVFVERATPVSLSVGGEEPASVYTHTETVGGLLAERGVELSERDSVTPALATRIRAGLAVSVTVVGEKIEVEETAIPFLTMYRDDPSLPQGETSVVQWGVDGLVRREYAVVYENGEAVSWELVSETTAPPTHRIVAQGTMVVVPAAPAPSPPSPPSSDPQCIRTMRVWATWYTAASAGGSGRTATGTTVRKGTVAVDPRVISLGTRMYIPGYGNGVAEDTGGAIIGNIIDLGYGANDVKDWSSRYVDICILN